VQSGTLVAGVALSLFASFSPARSQFPGQKTWCNPIDIDYKYSVEETKEGISYRSGADPVIVNHRHAYFLFVTNSGGWWRSTDLLHWEFVRPSMWPEEDMCAPAVLSVRDTLYLFQSTFERRPIYFTTSPQDGHLQYFNPLLPPLPGALGPWDPDLFHDDRSDRWYMYFGSSNVYPIYGIELDRTKGLTYIDRAKPLLSLHPDRHGWERFGPDHRDTVRPYIEGAWMTEHEGRYYLQYAAPGTEYNVYANGTYVGDSPLGPFTYAPYNPVSYKPGGFMAGAGHGNTFRDNFGNYWNTGTPWVAVNFNFERRIAMFPAGFDRDGQMYSNTRFGDFPHFLPARKWTGRDELFAGWMLLSYRKPCISSSARDSFPASNVTDENPRTFWVAGANKPGEWIALDLERPATVRAVQVNYADYRSGVFSRDSAVATQFRLSHSADGKKWKVLADLSGEQRDRPDAYIELPLPVRTRFIRYEHIHVASANLAISDIRIFGKGDGPPPRIPGNLHVRRHADPRNATVTWDGVGGAVGYNILWGIARDRLYQTYQVFADRPDTLEVRALDAGQGYYFAIEAFSGNGVSRRCDPVTLK
jgi:xylan 1,4-beta-xylosidase